MWIGTLLFALGSGGELFFHSLSWLCKISHPMPCLLENKLTMHSGFGSHFCFCSCLSESVLQVQMAEKMPVNYPLLSRSSPTPFPWGKNAEVIVTANITHVLIFLDCAFYGWESISTEYAEVQDRGLACENAVKGADTNILIRKRKW
jgi:hypothetical protein